jgi:hypothetical protein
MFSAWNYAINMLIFFLLIGIALYMLDRKVGIAIYRGFYNAFHKNHKMPEEHAKGFLYRQRTNRKVAVAGTLSTVASIYGAIHDPGVNLLAGLALWLLMMPTMFLGFWIGSLIYRILPHRAKIFDTMDDLGEKLSSGGIKEVTGHAVGAGSDAAQKIFARARNVIWPVSPPPTPPAPPPAPVQEVVPPAPVSEQDANEALDRYVRRR